MIFDRRKLLGATVAGGTALLASFKATAKFIGDVEMRGQIGRLERLPTLAAEAQEDFSTSLRKWVDGDLNRAAEQRAMEIFKANGLTDADATPFAKIVELLESDPIVMALTHTWINGQLLMWQRLQSAFHSDAERYLAEMEAVDGKGPGSLELNPKMDIPAYTAWEIHNQPGGYVGDPFAGHMYHYGTNNLYLHRNDQDGAYANTAAGIETPDDKKVKRILDLGTGIGQLPVAMKARFPDAEVWGIDVGGPMVRFAHMRAADLGVDVHFAQRLAEDTKFPDNHFDIVIANILFHEVNPDGAKAIFREANRVLRPGGVFVPREQRFVSPVARKTPGSKFRNWWNDRWNHEVWSLTYLSLDHPAEMKNAGLEVKNLAEPGYRGAGRTVFGVKKA